jgi:hypothetical protein
VIVGEYFQGDSATVEAWRQHNVYGSALNCIIHNCNDAALTAQKIMGCHGPDGWGRVASIDHRALQMAHDILAAVWRWSFDLGQLKFPWHPKYISPLSIEDHWLRWLSREVRSWQQQDAILIYEVQRILLNQNKGAGYRAEDRLTRLLVEKFVNVPWLERYQNLRWDQGPLVGRQCELGINLLL